MASTAFQVEVWLLIVEKCDYNDVRRLWMTGSSLIRIVVPRIRSISFENGGSTLRSPALLSRMSNLRNLSIRLFFNMGGKYLAGDHMLPGTPLLQSFILSNTNWGDRASSVRLPFLQTRYPQLEELQFLGFPLMKSALSSTFVSELPKTLTRFISPSQRIFGGAVTLLPSTITDLQLNIRRVGLADSQETTEPENEKNENFEKPEALKFPPSLTRLRASINGESRLIYEGVPPTVTDLEVHTAWGEISPPWQLLSPNLVSLSAKIKHLTVELASLLPRGLLSLEVSPDDHPKTAALLALPQTLIYLGINSPNADPNGFEAEELSIKVDALPPALTGLEFRLKSDFLDPVFPTLDLSLKYEERRDFILNKAFGTNHSAEKDDKSDAKGANFSGPGIERLRLVTRSNMVDNGTKDSEKQQTSINPSSRAHWIVPERFKKIELHFKSCLAEDIIATPRTAHAISIYSIDRQVYYNEVDGDQAETAAKEKEIIWKKAIDHIQHNLPSLKILRIEEDYKHLKGISNNLKAPLRELTLPLGLLTETPNFPSSLSTLQIDQSNYANVRYRPTEEEKSENADDREQEDAENVFIPNPKPFLLSLPPMLVSLTIFHQYEIPIELIPLLPINLKALSCYFSQSNEETVQHLKNLPPTLQYIDACFERRFVFSIDVARVLPGSLHFVYISYSSKEGEQRIEDAIQNDEIFQLLPKEMQQFYIEETDIFEERDKWLKERDAVERSQ